MSYTHVPISYLIINKAVIQMTRAVLVVSHKLVDLSARPLLINKKELTFPIDHYEMFDYVERQSIFIHGIDAEHAFSAEIEDMKKRLHNKILADASSVKIKSDQITYITKESDKGIIQYPVARSLYLVIKTLIQKLLVSGSKMPLRTFGLVPLLKIVPLHDAISKAFDKHVEKDLQIDDLGDIAQQNKTTIILLIYLAPTTITYSPEMPNKLGTDFLDSEFIEYTRIIKPTTTNTSGWDFSGRLWDNDEWTNTLILETNDKKLFNVLGFWESNLTMYKSPRIQKIAKFVKNGLQVPVMERSDEEILAEHIFMPPSAKIIALEIEKKAPSVEVQAIKQRVVSHSVSDIMELLKTNKILDTHSVTAIGLYTSMSNIFLRRIMKSGYDFATYFPQHLQSTIVLDIITKSYQIIANFKKMLFKLPSLEITEGQISDMLFSLIDMNQLFEFSYS